MDRLQEHAEALGITSIAVKDGYLVTVDGQLLTLSPVEFALALLDWARHLRTAHAI